MRKPIHIASPEPTLEERVKHLRVPKARQKELQVLVDEFRAKLSDQEQSSPGSMKPEKRRKSASAA
jgi:hypothetical protein